MQRYTIFFIIVNALHVSEGCSAHHQELKNCTYSIEYMSSLLAATASGSSKQARHTWSVRKVSDLWPGKRNWLTWSVGHL